MHARRVRSPEIFRVADAMRNDARLSRSGARENQERAFRLSYSFLLCRIQRGEKIHLVAGSQSPVARKHNVFSGYWILASDYYYTVTLFARFLG